MEEYKRIRVIFEDDDILSEAQKSDGLNRSWVLLKLRANDTVYDVATHLVRAFQLYLSCPHGLILSISGFVLPELESASILKDNEIIRARKRKDNLFIPGNNAANGAARLRPREILMTSAAGKSVANEAETSRAAEKQPVNNGVLLLAYEEFEKEKGGYESDDPEEDNEEDMLEGNQDSRKQKRKAVEKLQGSKKKKKQRSEATGSIANDVCKEKLDNSLKVGDLSKKSRSFEEKKDEMDAGDNVENNEETAKLNDKIEVSLPDMRDTEVQENSKEAEDAKIAAKETKKLPSRSARRKYAKRRFLKEMAKIQKQNATCESEGLRNWKEDHAKDERKKVGGQLKGHHKWKKRQADAERKETDDDQPKGLLHLKLSPQSNRFAKGPKRERRNKKDYFLKRPNQNDHVHEQRNQNGNWHELPTQNGDGLEQQNQRQGDVHEQPGQKSECAKELPNQNCDASNQFNEESDEEREVVPIVIRPGHIRFEPLEKGEIVQQNHAPLENFQWNGITSKKKGQQWGKENRSFTPRNNDYKQSNKEQSEILSNGKEKQSDEVINFDKLPPLTTIPKEGDLIAYRVLELSSSWTPELSPFRVGKVSWFDAESNQTMLVPVQEYPLVSKKAGEDEDEQLDNSLYKEDGSLEIDFSSLIDARIFNKRSLEPGNEAVSCVSEGSIDNENPAKTMLSSSNNQTVVPSTESNQGEETQPPTAEIGGVDIWEQVSEVLHAKKEQLSKKNGWEPWCKPPKKVQPPSPVSVWGKNAKTVQPPPSEGSGWGKNVQKVQPSQDNNWGKQGSGNKSSYKALRGSGLGPTMARLRSTNNNT